MDPPFSFLIRDDRRDVPTLQLMVDGDEAAALRWADADLAANPHHVAVEVYDGASLLFTVRRSDRCDPGVTAPLPDSAGSPSDSSDPIT